MKRVWRIFKRNRRMLTCTILAMTAGVLLGVCICLPGEELPPDTSTASVPGESQILPSAQLRMDAHFSKCPHIVETTLDAADYVGYTKKQLAEVFPTASIVSFSGSSVQFIRAYAGYCPAHFILRTSDTGELCILSTDAETLEPMPVQEVLFNDELLPLEIRVELAAGLAFDSLDQINSYLESFES